MNWLGMIAVGLAAMVATSASADSRWLKDWRKANPVWKGVHLSVGNDKDLDTLGLQVPALAKQGVNVLIVEVDYSYQFTKRPEMANPNGISKAEARKFTDLCHKNGIRPIPQINCLGHQSWAETTDVLLTKHPELDETPGQYPNNKDIYCRSWCPQHPDLLKVVLPLIDDLVDGFQADAFHVGMDEVFIIGSDFCPRCKGQDRAKLFAKQVNDFYNHIVKKRHLEMFMWGDRLLDGKATGFGEWEASENGTFPAIDLIPKDIVMCDWHYEGPNGYPSLQVFIDKGFRVWPSTWKQEDNAEAFAKTGKAMDNKLVVGHLVTTWGAVKTEDLATWPALIKPFAIWPSR